MPLGLVLAAPFAGKLASTALDVGKNVLGLGSKTDSLSSPLQSAAYTLLGGGAKAMLAAAILL